MCKQCETKPVYEFTNKRRLCRRCFVNYFQKKFLYIVRNFGMIKKGDIIGYRNSGSFQDVVLKNLLELFCEKVNIQIVKLHSKKKISKTAVSSAIDSESNKFVNEIIRGDLKKIKKLFPVDGKIIKPLYLFLDSEVLLYARLKKLKFKEMNLKENKISNFINELEEKHPEIKRATMNCFLKLQEFV